MLISFDADETTWHAVQAAAIRDLERQLASAETKLRRASDARRALPPGSSRARVTTANARWSTVAEAVNRIERALAAVREAS